MWLHAQGATRAPVGAASVPFQTLIHVERAVGVRVYREDAQGGVYVCVRVGWGCLQSWLLTADDLMRATPREPQI